MTEAGLLDDWTTPTVPRCRKALAIWEVELDLNLASEKHYFLAATLSFIADRSPKRNENLALNLLDLAAALLHALHYSVGPIEAFESEAVERYQRENRDHWCLVAKRCFTLPRWSTEIHGHFDKHFRKQVRWLVYGCYDPNSTLYALPPHCLTATVEELAATGAYLESRISGHRAAHN